MSREAERQISADAIHASMTLQKKTQGTPPVVLADPRSTITVNGLTPSDPACLVGIEVLLVDDAHDIRVLVSTLLRRAGAAVRAVEGAVAALLALKSIRPSIIISDISMPEIDGFELMRMIRALPPDGGGNIPAIALTACAGEKDRQMAFAVGYQAHVAKPVGTQGLIAVVAALAVPSSSVH